MIYISTRNRLNKKTFLPVLRTGLAEDGGLFVPEKLPALDQNFLTAAADLSYQQVARHIIGLFVGQDIPSADLDKIVAASFASFYHPEIAPLKKLNATTYLLELFHGPTLAFKDYALQVLGQFFRYDQRQNLSAQTLLVATSGDTGSSAISAVKGIPGLKIVVLYPHNRVSDIQRRQMTTVLDENVVNLAVEGDFDDCQRLIKAVFLDVDLKKVITLGSVNSINWVRLLAQIVYYVKASAALKKQTGKDVSFSVPTGNFGNIYAGFLAKRMGAPINRFYLATNRNDILARFFKNGVMEKKDVAQTLSPSMDIQVASNFERFLYDLVDGDTNKVKDLMGEFQSFGRFELKGDEFKRAQDIFSAIAIDDAQTLKTIKAIYTDTSEMIDPHTAIAVAAAEKLRKEKDEVVVAIATAHPAKFPEAVTKATGETPKLPSFLTDILSKEERFKLVKPSLDALKSELLKKD